MTNKPKCQYYNEKTKRCTIGYCKLRYLYDDGSCKKNGNIPDLFGKKAEFRLQGWGF